MKWKKRHIQTDWKGTKSKTTSKTKITTYVNRLQTYKHWKQKLKTLNGTKTCQKEYYIKIQIETEKGIR